MHKRVYAIWFLVVALVLGAWNISPRADAAKAQPFQDDTLECDQAAAGLAASPAESAEINNLIKEICSFRIRPSQVSRSAPELDRQFIENAIAANTLEIQSLQYTRERVTNAEWRSLIEMMIAMHTADLQTAITLAERLGANTEPDLTDARVYPGTPAYDLGMRRIDLQAQFLEPLMAIGAGVPGGVTPTPVVGETATPGMDLTATPTDEMTATPGSGLTSTPTDEMTATPTTEVTMTPDTDLTATPTDVMTSTPEMDLTATPTDEMTTTPEVDLTATPTTGATATPVLDLAATPTQVLTETPVGPGMGVSFDFLSLDLIEDEHVMILETTIAAQRLVRNDEIRAFAKHSADVARLHLLLMRELKMRLAYSFTAPLPALESEYQSPRRFEPR